MDISQGRLSRLFLHYENKYARVIGINGVWAMSFEKKLRRVHEFFKPENLKRTTITVDKIPGDTALLVIDVQKEFCDPKKKRGTMETDRIAKRIQSIIPAFREAGIPAYVIYFRKKNIFSKFRKIDFHHFSPEPSDMLVAKDKDSAFEGSNIGELLKQHRRTKILACGFNLNACVYQTVRDAIRQGFDVSVLEDLVGNDKKNPASVTSDYIRRMKMMEIDFRSSAEALKASAGAKAAKRKRVARRRRKSRLAENKKATR